MFTIASRLKEERERLGLKQAPMADACGVSRPTQVAYESGNRVPDAAYLALAASLGVDVGYIITGMATAMPRPEEVELLRRYRSASAEYRNAAMAVLGAALQPMMAAQAPNDQQTRGGAVVGGDVHGQVLSGNQTIGSQTLHIGGAGQKAKKKGATK
ncbi:helix-turn-helix transcriptional regulator [Lysobacter sp. K5869]|uniref:helix-turn-helix domain-containing protein n=1 Tax=Lysobacter sp. K5869 TaxID=2820808 RepID=UPI001C061B88|nr:helix-turn-helix domain-containing protein [Lysobacter sp. K5869]QWP76072.1 helix-turn-helix transcriptional regulator [Lysobacter sp. K5869]